MKFQVEHDVFTDSITWIARNLPVRPPVPVLAGVLIEATEEQEVILSSFDYSISARCKMEAKVEIPGTVLVPGRLLADISKALPNKEISFALTEQESPLLVTCGSSKFNLPTLLEDEYPELPKFPKLVGTIDAKDLSEVASQVGSAASQDGALPMLTGVRLEIEGSEISFIATDRYRLALRIVDWNPENTEISTDALVDAHFLSDIAKNLTQVGEVAIHLDEEGSNIIGFSANNRQATSTLVEGIYPPVRNLFPETSETTAVVNLDELQKALKRVSLVGGNRGSSVNLHFANNELVLDSGMQNNAHATEALSVDYQGEDLDILFNADYLLSGLAALRSDVVCFNFTTNTQPTLLTSKVNNAENSKDIDLKYLIMPLRDK